MVDTVNANVTVLDDEHQVFASGDVVQYHEVEYSTIIRAAVYSRSLPSMQADGELSPLVFFTRFR